MSTLPETNVLAVASHVAYGYVGNTMATFVMQCLGAQVSAINTVSYSNHAGYRQLKGRKATAEEVLDIYAGLQKSYLAEFDVLLSGYVPTAEVVEAVGKIARDIKNNASSKPGSFFWILDPVMGDNGKLYIPEAEVPVYKSLLKDADLILPNRFEAELLSEVKVTDLPSLASAIKVIHKNHGVPHIVVTSLRISKENNQTLPGPVDGTDDMLSVVGSSATSTGEPRLWRIDVPALPVFFSGTGDMFAALMVVRLREAAAAANLLATASWRSPDAVPAADTPLALATARILASMQGVLSKTYQKYSVEAPKIEAQLEKDGSGAIEELEKKRYLLKTKAAEVNVVRNVRDLLEPPEVEKYKARALEVDVS